MHVRRGKNYTPYKHYTKENLDRAVQAVKNGSTILAAAERFCVPKSPVNRVYLKQNIYTNPGRPTIFTQEEERHFVNHLNLVSSWGFPFDLMDLRIFVKNYLDKKGIQERRLNNNVPGRDWALNFLKRHKNELSNRYSSNISTKRAALSANIIDNFFDNAKDLSTSTDPSLIINFDETNLSDNPGNKKFIYKRGTKYPERVINSTKTAISLMYAGSATGCLLPIYVVYKGEHLWDSWKEGGHPGTRYNRSRSGWFDSVCFEDWFFSVIVPFFKNKDGQKIIIGDNLSSHFSEAVLKKCQELNIAFICLPSNGTHILQPLDVSFYAPLKKYWREILTHWKKTKGRKMSTLSKDVFPQLLKALQEKLDDGGKGSQNLISGFSKTGLYPFDPSRPKQRLPPEEITNAHTPSLVSDSVLEILKQMRTSGSESNETRKPRRKRLNVEPGKSICAEDLLASSSLMDMTPSCSRKSTENIIDAANEEDVISENSFDSDDLPLITLVNRENTATPLELDEQMLPVGQWILVQYIGKKNRHFIGQIIKKRKENHAWIFRVIFLKKSNKTERFLKPATEDVDDVTLDMVVKKLGNPKIEGTGRRQFFTFSDYLETFNIS